MQSFQAISETTPIQGDKSFLVILSTCNQEAYIYLEWACLAQNYSPG